MRNGIKHNHDRMGEKVADVVREKVSANVGANVSANASVNNNNNDSNNDRLSWGDTVFLHLEREGMPLNVASVCIFEGKIPFKACIRFVESKLPLIPRYLKRVVPTPLNIGLPHWEYDPVFDIHNHVREATLKHGSDAELKTLAGKILSTVMDRQHPLWDFTLVHGLNGNRSGLIFRLHHCLADGIAGVGIMNAIMDTNPAVHRLPRRKLQLPVPQPRCVLTSLTNGLVDSYSDLVRQALDGYMDISSIAERFASNGGSDAQGEFSDLLPELSLSTQPLRFNVLYRGPQKFAWAEVPLEEIKAIKSACGTSVNDVILALVTGTIRRYLELHGDRVNGRLFRMMVPVNLRGDGSPGDLGNRISLVPVTVPLDIRDPLKLLAAVHERTGLLKRAHTAELVSLAGGLIGMVPSSARALAGSVISRLPFTPFNMVCTNVPGPQSPLYILGHKLLHCYPYVPIGGEMALNCAILTYNGAAYFGFSGDVHAVPDLRRLETLLMASFTELRDAAGVTPPRKKAGKETRKKIVRAKAKVAAPPRAAQQSVRAPAPPSPSTSVKSSIAPNPTITEEKVLTRLTA